MCVLDFLFTDGGGGYNVGMTQMRGYLLYSIYFPQDHDVMVLHILLLDLDFDLVWNVRMLLCIDYWWSSGRTISG